MDGHARARDFYAILDIQRDAGADAIKRGYKKMALRWHPDKRTPDMDPTEADQTFQNVREAFEVLSDPQLRKIYDKYGENGVAMSKSAAGFIDPELFLML
ncbi:putative heat shock protein DnaJ, partial [Blyttiomyces helicus]